jgi:general secretion pathway protein H
LANLRRAGFTLLELLVVLAIAGLLVALVPPLVSAAVPGTKAKVAARDLASTFREAHNQAISGGTAVEMQFTFDPPKYRIQGGPDHQLPAGIQMMFLEDGTGAAATTVADLARADDETYSLIFYPDGSSTGAAIRLGRDDLHYRISVGWLMGRVEISEPQTSAR